MKNIIQSDYKTMVQIFENASYIDVQKVELFTVRTSENGLIKFDVTASVFYTNNIVTSGKFEDFENALDILIKYRSDILEKDFPIDIMHYSSYEEFEKMKHEKEFFNMCEIFASYVNGLKNHNYSESDFFQTFIDVSLLDYIELGEQFSSKYEKFDNNISIEVVKDLETGLIEVNGNIIFNSEIVETDKIEFIMMNTTVKRIKKIIKEKIEELAESEE